MRRVRDNPPYLFKKIQLLCEPSQKGRFLDLPQPQAQTGPSFSIFTERGALPEPL